MPNLWPQRKDAAMPRNRDYETNMVEQGRRVSNWLWHGNTGGTRGLLDLFMSAPKKAEHATDKSKNSGRRQRNNRREY